MGIGEAEIRFKKENYDKERVEREVGKMGMGNFWRIEEDKKSYIARFKPPRVKLLKEFRKIS